ICAAALGERYAFPTFRAILMGLAVKVPVVGAGRIVMPFKFHRNGRHHIPRQKFRVTNWRDYEAALRSRGSLTIWFTAKAIADWRAQPRATPGGQRHYSDLAIETALTLRAVFGLALRQTEGLVGSIMQLLGIDLPVPDHTTFSRRAGGLKVLQKPRASSDPLHLIIDSTGLKLRGAGEWLFERHGTAKRRAWRKLHIGIDADTGEIVASDLTDKDVDDASHVGPMLDQLSLAPTSFIGDGAYDRGAVSELLARRNPDMSVLVPPCKAPCPDRTRCRRRPNAIGTFWKLRNGVECIGKKPLAITDARKSRRLSGVTNASSVTLSSHALTIAAKRKWRLPSKRSIGCVSSVRRSSFASHDHEAKGRMPSPRASMQQGCLRRAARGQRSSLHTPAPCLPPALRRRRRLPRICGPRYGSDCARRRDAWPGHAASPPR